MKVIKKGYFNPPLLSYLLEYSNTLSLIYCYKVLYKQSRAVGDDSMAAWYMSLINELSTLKLFDV